MMRIKNGRIELELHQLVRQEGPALLLLHALGGSSQDWAKDPLTAAVAEWSGPVFALDFSGHGQSEWVTGGAYYPELLAADADAALAAIGSAAVAGAGLGAYVALLLGGAQPDQVAAVLLLPGAGLTGGGASPDFDAEFPDWLVTPGHPSAPGSASGRIHEHGTNESCDPLVRVIDGLVRPPDYAEGFARAAHRLLLLEDEQPGPPWWEAARRSPSSESLRGDMLLAFRRLQGVTSTGC